MRILYTQRIVKYYLWKLRFASQSCRHQSFKRRGVRSLTLKVWSRRRSEPGGPGGLLIYPPESRSNQLWPKPLCNHFWPIGDHLWKKGGNLAGVIGCYCRTRPWLMISGYIVPTVTKGGGIAYTSWGKLAHNWLKSECGNKHFSSNLIKWNKICFVSSYKNIWLILWKYQRETNIMSCAHRTLNIV